ncbi:hypothetical protein TNCV_755071 [Trichonephila clavipes]|nr:hypothetical protein TNCV_755071 [Trichonephila clavipes]
MPPDPHMQDQAHEIYQGKGLDCTLVVSRSLEHHTGDSASGHVSTPNFEREQLREGGAVRGFHLSASSINLRRGL